MPVGVAGAYSRDCANRALAEADLVFFIGSHTGGQVTNNWMFPPPGTKIIQLDIYPAELGRNYPNAVSILGDEALPVVEAVPREEDFYDFSARYTIGRTTFVCPAQLNHDETAHVQELALDVYRLLGCRGFARIEGGHLYPMERPDETAAIVQSWLTEVPG